LYCAQALASAGAHVTITTRRRTDADRVTELLGESSAAIVADLADPQAAAGVAQQILAAAPCLHILVNNAGITWGAPIETYPQAAFAKVLQVDVVAGFQLVQALLPALEAAASDREPARVVNLGSIDGHAVGGFDNYAYAAAKAGVHHLTRVLAYRLGPRGITVNCIAPGPIRTRMTAALLDENGADLVERSPLRRLCEPEDIAGTLLYLVGPGARFVTGAVIPVDGGLSIGPWSPAPEQE
jgi:NAD(P)-dependent dehydrogenase (short-subunit alcohol dehydrogenase family)